jgi:hypothetical protein
MDGFSVPEKNPFVVMGTMTGFSVSGSSRVRFAVSRSCRNTGRFFDNSSTLSDIFNQVVSHQRASTVHFVAAHLA